MNISGVARSYMARHFQAEDFLIHVSKIVERQLKEWDESYEVIVVKLQNYLCWVKMDELYYTVELTEQEAEALKNEDPYAIDRKIWKELQSQGLPIIRGHGNYLDHVLKDS